MRWTHTEDAVICECYGKVKVAEKAYESAQKIDIKLFFERIDD